MRFVVSEEDIVLPGGRATITRKRGNEPTLVLLHGCGGNHESFEFVLPHLGEFDVVVPALPGRASSSGKPLESAEEAAAWVLALLRAMGISAFVVVGYSYGGAVAIEMALASAEHQELPRVLGLGLLSSGAKLRVAPGILEMAESAVVRGEPLLFGEMAYPASMSRERVARAEAIAGHVPPLATRADWRACNAFDRLHDITRISVPTLVVSGALDPMTPPKYAAYVASRVAGCRVATIEDGGHGLPAEKPEAVGAFLLSFMDEIKALHPSLAR